ncbi:DUF362 domain-containing protein [Candidatus Woesearchaeota archaeon]|nr:DUF362 domain-containing protein [Candidatus Woesearchaeota archaeon]MBW3016894.1 DUF362 domain-containing protein [Candidatus Woesearchaeota archaeon]
MASKVAVLKTSPETVIRDYANVMHLGEYQKHISRDEETILKLNLSWSLYYPGCSTQPWQLDGVLTTLKKDGYDNIRAVENKTVVTDPWLGASQNKWGKVLRKHNMQFEPLTDVEWSKYKIKRELTAIPRIFPEGHEIPKIFLGKNMIQLPTMKTHGHTQITGAMKNAFGGLITEKRHHCHKMIHEVLVDLLAIQKELHPGLFAVMDGTVAGTGKGPRTFKPVIKNILLSSADQVAIDAVEAKLMGFDPMSIPFIKMAHDRGLGTGDIAQLDIVGEDVHELNFGFKTKRSPVIYFDQMFRNKIGFLEKMFFHTRLFKLCVKGSAFYHDKLWYNLKGKRRVNKFMKTEWGELFKSY